MGFSPEAMRESALLQEEAMLQALVIFEKRNAVHKDLWMQEDLEGLLHQVKHKSMRIANNPQLDDALDLVNYAVFVLRKVSGDRWDVY